MSVSKIESEYQKRLKKRIKERYPGCYILKNDPACIQGIPDLLILYKSKWAALEVKKDSKATHRPNQDYRVNEMNKMSFAAFIFPENEEEVLSDLDRKFKASRKARAV